MNLKTWYKESYKKGREKAKQWQWYDNLFLGLIIFIFIISIIINDWGVTFLSGVLTLVILLNYWKLILIKLADNNCKKGNYEKAHQYLNKVLKKDEYNICALIKETEIYKKEENYQNAIDTCNKGLKKDSNNLKLLTLKVKLLKELKQYQKAINICNNILKIQLYYPKIEELKKELEKEIKK
ncbi:MAG: hypothetical protein K1X33_04360 [Methanobacteriaceae archaeon]|nr:hypothetical protein [Methanobacteriaceae archaeon]